MKDEKAKYLIIDSTEIQKQLYNLPDKIVEAKEFFDKYNIPKEFQKIIVKINIPFFMKYEAEEYTMGFPFDITAGKIEKQNNSKYISVNSHYPIFYNNQVFRDKIKFNTQLRYMKFDDIIYFLKEIDENGYLKLYLQSIKEFFDITLDLDYLLEEWNHQKNSTKGLKLYKRKSSKK